MTNLGCLANSYGKESIEKEVVFKVVGETPIGDYDCKIIEMQYANSTDNYTFYINEDGFGKVFFIDKDNLEYFDQPCLIPILDMGIEEGEDAPLFNEVTGYENHGYDVLKSFNLEIDGTNRKCIVLKGVFGKSGPGVWIEGVGMNFDYIQWNVTMPTSGATTEYRFDKLYDNGKLIADASTFMQVLEIAGIPFHSTVNTPKEESRSNSGYIAVGGLPVSNPEKGKIVINPITRKKTILN